MRYRGHYTLKGFYLLLYSILLQKYNTVYVNSFIHGLIEFY